MSRYQDQNGKFWESEAEYRYFQKLAPVKPTVTKDTTFGGTIEDHRAFGQIGASRVQGSAVLYGSDFPHSGGFIKISVTKSRLRRSLSRDWASSGNEIVEVWLSEAQWAAFVSTLNYGTGIQCTIRSIQGEDVIPAIAERVDRREQFKAEASEDLVEAEARIDEALALVKAGKMRKSELEGLLTMAKNKMVDGVNFVAKSFGEHVETTMEHAKIEVEAYLQGAISRAGLEALGARPTLSENLRESERLSDGHADTLGPQQGDIEIDTIP